MYRDAGSHLRLRREFVVCLRKFASLLWRGPAERLASVRRWLFGSSGGAPAPRGPRRNAGFVDSLRLDVRFALRSLRLAPGFAFTAVATLAIAIGANAAVFAVVDATLLRPLPLPDAERLVLVWRANPAVPTPDGQGIRRFDLTPAGFLELSGLTGTMEALAGYRWYQGSVRQRVSGEPVRAMAVTSGFFGVVPTRPVAGRLFDVADGAADAEAVVLLGETYWRNRLGGDPAIVGSKLDVGELPHTVVGIVPSSFKMFAAQRWSNWSPVLADGPDVWTVTRPSPSSPLWPRLWLLYAAVGIVLLIACVNVANLQLAQLRLRRSELALRAALGAGRLQIMRQLLVENLVLGVAAAGVGVLVATWLLGVMQAAAPVEIARLNEASIDLRVLGYLLVVALGTVVLFGLAPAWGTGTVNLRQIIVQAPSQGRRMSFGKLLVGLEAGLALILLGGAGLMLTTLWNLERIDPGFSVEGLYAVSVDLPRDGYAEVIDRGRVGELLRITPRAATVRTQLAERLESTPGVSGVGYTAILPLFGVGNWAATVDVGDTSRELSGPERRTLPQGNFFPVNEAYFRTLGVPLLRGRAFNERDTSEGERVVILDEVFAQQLFPDGNALGSRVRVFEDAFLDFAPMVGDVRVVVGIAGAIRSGEYEQAAQPTVYVPYDQRRDTYPSSRRYWWQMVTFVVRSQLTGAELHDAFSSIVQDVAPEAVIEHKGFLSNLLVNRHQLQRRFFTKLLGGLAGIALLLAALGVYGMVALAVNARMHEIGVRRAVGAPAREIITRLLAFGLGPVLVGVLFGVGGALATTKMLQGMLYDVSPTDPGTLAAVALLLVFVAAAASLLAARRALRIDPVAVLRVE